MNRNQVSPTGKRFCRDYCRRLHRALHDLPDLQRRLVPQSRDSILRYLEEHPDADDEALYTRFGLPEQAALEAIAALDPIDLQNRLQRYRRRRLVVSLIVAAAFLYAVVSCVRLEITYINDDSYDLIGPAIVLDGPIPTNPPD